MGGEECLVDWTEGECEQVHLCAGEMVTGGGEGKRGLGQRASREHGRTLLEIVGIGKSMGPAQRSVGGWASVRRF